MCLVWLLVSQGLFFGLVVAIMCDKHQPLIAGEIPVQYADSLEYYSGYYTVRAYSACRYGNLLAEWPLAAA